MSLAHVEPEQDQRQFAASVGRNIKSLLAMRGMQAQHLALHIGMSEPVLSQRMSGRSKWLGMELDRIARAFAVDTDVIFAATEQDFREALARSRCSSLPPMSETLSDGIDVIGFATNEVRGQRRMALAGC